MNTYVNIVDYIYICRVGIAQCVRSTMCAYLLHVGACKSKVGGIYTGSKTTQGGPRQTREKQGKLGMNSTAEGEREGETKAK